jgi:hypothetical protein
LLAGCDAGQRELEDTVGPPLRVVSTYPEDGAGFDCPATDLECGVPIDTVFEIRFDRYLLPSTAVRQSFLVYTGTEGNAVPGAEVPALTPRYDVIERVVSYELPAGVTLEPNTHYTTELAVAVGEDDFGFRGFDARPLDEQTTVRTSFLTSNQRKMPVTTPPDGTCATAVSTLSGHCTTSSCHNSKDLRMGMDLRDPNGLILTAIGQVAHGSETGPKTGVPTQNPDRFGVAMPRIDPGRPDNSYLFYKLLLLPENYWAFHDEPDLCGTSHLAPVGEDCVSVLASAEENQRLQEWFLRGIGMPRSVGEAEPRYLIRQELRGLESWIRAGARCP